MDQADKLPNHRTKIDARNFLVEEKFDTWLELDHHCNLLSNLSLYSEWEDALPNIKKHLLGDESSIELKLAGIKPQNLINYTLTPCLPAIFIRFILDTKPTQCYLPFRRVRQLIRDCQITTNKSVELQLQHMLSHCGTNYSQYLHRNINYNAVMMSAFPKTLISSFYALLDFHNIMKHYKNLFSASAGNTPYRRVKKRLETFTNIVKVPSLEGSVIISKDLLLFTTSSGKFALNNQLWLETFNKITELHNTLLFNHYQSVSILPANHYNLVEKFILHCAKKVSKYWICGFDVNKLAAENTGFKYLKVIEGLGVSHIIKVNDLIAGWDNDTLCRALWTSVYQDKLDPEPNYARSYIFNLFNEGNTAQIADILGLVKIVGHPSIEVAKGLQELNERTHSNIIVDPAIVNRSQGILTRDICLNFYRKHKRYPNLSTRDPLITPQLHRLLDSNNDPSTPAMRQLWNEITPEDWSRVEFLQNEEFDPVHNQLSMIKDTSSGLTKSKVLRLLLNTQLCETCDFLTRDTCEKCPNRKERLNSRVDMRTLLSFLINESFNTDFLNYLEKYQQDEHWRDTVLKYLVIKLTPKELEEKPMGRFFGASPVVERNRRVVQEYNMMKFMDSYLPDQLMTPNELQMIQKLYSFRKIGQLYKHSTTLQVSFDFSKWNNNMRHESIDIPAGQIFDRWFNTRIYGKTMQAYQQMLYYYCNKDFKSYWEGQLGGIEGLNQATWSAIFIGGIKQAIEGAGQIYQLTVKGDDVRAAIVIRDDMLRRHDLQAVKDDIMQRIQRLCHAMGWQLNPHESFISITTICTSKQYQVNDTWLPAASKKMMKAESLANLVFPTLEDIISNIYSTCHSACSQSTAVLPCYITATFIASRVMITELQDKKLNLDQILALLIWPQILSGPGALPLQVFFIRGENDMLAVTISLYRYIIISQPNSNLTKFIKLILSQLMDKKPDKRLLLADAYSIPISAPTRPSSLLKATMIKLLGRWVKNRHLKVLFTRKTNIDKDKFVDTLISMRPYYAKLSTVLWENSPYYLVEEVIMKFANSGTLVTFFSRGNHGSMSIGLAFRQIQIIVDAAQKRISYWSNALKGLNHIDSNKFLSLDKNVFTDLRICSTQITQMIRDSAWNMEIKGITYPSLIDQNVFLLPDDLTLDYPGVITEGLYSQCIIDQNKFVRQIDTESHHFCANPNEIPWLGSTTSSKVSMPIKAGNISSSVLKKLIRLIEIRQNGEYFGADFVSIVDNLLSAMTHIPLNTLLILSPEQGYGHLAHRVQINSYSMTTMPNCRPNLLQLCKVEDDHLRVVQHDHFDRTINYAARHYFIKLMSLIPLQLSMYLPPNHPEMIIVFFHGFIDQNMQYNLCPHCCAILLDEEVTYDLTKMPSLRYLRQYEYIGASREDEKILRDNMINVAMTKVRNYLVQRGLDPNNPLFVRLATSQIIHTLSSESQEIYNIIQSRRCDVIPEGESLKLALASLGYYNLGSSQISLNAIRSMPREILYQSVLSEFFSYFIDNVIGINPFITSIMMSHMLPHMNPLTNLLSRIMSANKLPALILGANDVNYLGTKLTLTHGASSSAKTAANHFLTSHLDLFKRWLDTGLNVPNQIKFFVNYESGINIQDYLLRYLRKFRIIASRLLVIPDRNLRPQTYLIDFLIKQHVINPNAARSTWVLRNNITDEQILNRLQQRVERDLAQLGDEESSVIIDLLIRFYSANLVHVIFEASDDVLEFDTVFDAQNPEVMLTNPISYEVRNLRYHKIDELFNVEIYVYRLFKSLHSVELVDRIWDILSNFYQTFVNQYGLHTLISDLLNTVFRRLAWYNKILISVMTNEDASRLLRSRHPDWEENLKHLINLQPPNIDHEHNFKDIGLINNVYNQCGLQRYHPDPRTAQGNLVIDQTEILDNNLYEEYVNIWSLHHRLRGLFIPSINFNDKYRFLGYLNKSVAKFIDIYLILEMPQITELYPEKFIDIVIGDGGGGISRFLLENNRENEVIYCSLANLPYLRQYQADNSLHNAPVEFLSDQQSQELINRLHYTATYPGDITSKDVQTMLHNLCVNLQYEVRLIVSDIDKPNNKSWVAYYSMLWDVVKVAIKSGSHQSLIIIKILLSSTRECLTFLINISALFQHFHLYSSVVERLYTTEMHLILGKRRENLCTIEQVEELQKNPLLKFDIPPVMMQRIYAPLNYMLSKVNKWLCIYLEKAPPSFQFFFRCARQLIPIASPAVIFPAMTGIICPTTTEFCDQMRLLFNKTLDLLEEYSDFLAQYFTQDIFHAARRRDVAKLNQILKVTTRTQFKLSNIKRILYLLTLKYIIQLTDRRLELNDNFPVCDIMRAVIQEFYLYFPGDIRIFHFANARGYLFLHNDQYVINYTLMAAEVFKWYNRLMGYHMYVATIISNVVHNNLASNQELLHQLGLEVQDCCIDYSNLIVETRTLETRFKLSTRLLCDAEFHSKDPDMIRHANLTLPEWEALNYEVIPALVNNEHIGAVGLSKSDLNTLSNVRYLEEDPTYVRYVEAQMAGLEILEDNQENED